MAFRFPKNQILSCFRTAQGGMIQSSSSLTHFTFDENVVQRVAPARFSNVRKVIFCLNTGKFGDGTTMGGQLQVAASSLAANPASPTKEEFNLPFSTVLEGSSGDGFDPTNRTLFSRFGPTTTIGEDPVTVSNHEHAQLMQIEFDRFDINDQDFFDYWDSFTGQDEYAAFYPEIEVVSTDASVAFAMRFADWQMTILQAPGPDNATCTDKQGFAGVIDITETTTAFNSVDVYARTTFRYIADDWDNLDSISVVYAGAVSSGTSLEIQVIDITDSNTVLFTDTFTVGAGNHYVARTRDFSASLVDGRVYGTRHRVVGAAGTVSPRGSGYFTVVQSAGFARTPAIFEMSGVACTPNGVDCFVNESDIRSCLFDPLWFEDIEDARILKRKFFAGVYHQNASNNPSMDIRVDPDLLSDDSGRAAPLSVSLAPSFSHTGGPSGSLQQDFVDITANDPLNLAGQRRLQKSYPSGSVWNGAPGDRPGHIGLYYALDIPVTEEVELGPVFDLSEFDAEGCASTAAGLGDNPGVLAITNGSSVPQKFNPTAGRITNLGIEPPYRGETPQVTTQDSAFSPDGGLDLGIYKYRYTLCNSCTGKESDPNPEDITADTSGLVGPAAQVTLSFANVRIPGDPQIDRICIYRTVEGADFPIMAKVGDFDPDVTSVFVDTVADTALDFTNEGLSLLNGIPPCAPVVVEYRNRLFMMGDIPDLSPAGTVNVTQDSDTVLGSTDVEWNRCLIGKFFQIEGDCKAYEISEILPPVAGTSPGIQRLKLTEPYEGPTDTDLRYTICGRPNRVYISEPLEPECWPAANFIDVEPGDGDRIIGAVSNFNTLVICKRNKTYTLTFREQPATEVNVPARVSSDIGCIAPRSFAQIESGSVWLSDRGLALYDGRSVRHIPESDSINTLFVDSDHPRYVRRDRNGRVIGAIGVFYPKREQYLLLLPTVQTSRGANLMLVWDYHLKNVTFYEFCQEFTAMEVAKDDDGNERVYLGDSNGFVWIFDIGDTDGVGFPNATGTVRGTVTSAGVEGGVSFLEDTTASFVRGGIPGLGNLSGVSGLSGFTGTTQMGLAGVCVFTRAAGAEKDEPWTVRTIFTSNGSKLYVTPSWGGDTPSVGDDYMLGAIDMLAEFKPQNLGTDDVLKRNWSQVIVHQPETVASELRVEIIPDLQNVDPEEDTVVDTDGETGKGRIFRMDYSRGRQVKPVGRDIHNFEKIRMSNFAPDEPIRLINHIMRKTPKRGG
jgi:hypothetical protein